NSIRPTPAEPRPPPSGTNRMWLSVYSPWPPTGISIDGLPATFEVQSELGRYVASGFVDIPAGATRTVTMSVSGSVRPGADYVLDVTGQPQPTPEQLHLTVEAVGQHDRIARFDGPLIGDDRIVVRAVQ
ncbi:MAG TPA: hypothetical protein VM282_09160, partial [Acidimicrobiales bacterium]|nr:hypothetical protein [Acidimicrobiales bacterium]